jgi:hypothetical protein
MKRVQRFSGFRWIVVTVTTVALAGAVLAADYAIDWHTVDGGGAGPANASSGGTYTLSGTVGQSDARNHPQAMSGGGYRLTGGFWVIPECPAIPADYDSDCDVDQADYQAFEVCASGPGVSFAAGCEGRDLDHDNDVDQADFATFQKCFNGPDRPPACS